MKIGEEEKNKRSEIKKEKTLTFYSTLQYKYK